MTRVNTGITGGNPRSLAGCVEHRQLQKIPRRRPRRPRILSVKLATVAVRQCCRLRQLTKQHQTKELPAQKLCSAKAVRGRAILTKAVANNRCAPSAAGRVTKQKTVIQSRSILTPTLHCVRSATGKGTLLTIATSVQPSFAKKSSYRQYWQNKALRTQTS